MKFYCLHEGFYEGVQTRLDQIKLACETLKIEFMALNSLTTNHSNLPTLTNTDLLYNATRGSEILENLLLNNDVITFYRNNPELVGSNTDTAKYSIIHQKAGLYVPKTIFRLSANRLLLRKYVDYLGGFPIIIKATESTMGIGVLKIESWQNLISTVDYLITTNGKFILRQFIANTGTARLIVLGDKVIASVFRENQFDDFRVSGGEKPIIDYPQEFDEAANKLAITATHLANLDTAGVDIVFDKSQNPYLLEINFPHNFVRPQQITGLNIAEKMVEYLIEKSQK